MKTMYQWLGESGERRLVVTNTQTREELEIPFEVAYANVANSNLYGAQSVDELYVAKVAADCSGNIETLRKRMLGEPVSSVRERELLAEADRLRAEAAELRAKLAAATAGEATGE